MVKVGLYVHLHAKEGREEELAKFLAGAVPLVEAEPETRAWFALRLDRSSFAIFDAFADEAGRRAHLEGAVASALVASADELLATPPDIRPVGVIASKL